MELDYKLISNVELDGLDQKDYPDFVDAYINSADYNGEPMTEEQLNAINEDSDYVYAHIVEQGYA